MSGEGPDEIAFLLIDAPVHPYSPEDEILAWLEELARLRVEYDGNAAVLENIKDAERRARGDLEWKRRST